MPASETAAPTPDQRSPTAGKPYVSLATPTGGIEKLGAGGQITVAGRGFAPRASLEVLIDGAVVEKAAVREDGGFSVTVTAPQSLGIDTLTVRDAATQRVIDGAQLRVNRGDVARAGDARGAEEGRAGQRVRIVPPVRRR